MRSGGSQGSRRMGEKVRAAKTVFCAEQSFLRSLAQVPGDKRVTVWVMGPKDYRVSLKLQNQSHEWFVSTFREKARPRAFRDLKGAVNFAHQELKASTVTLAFQKPPSASPF